MKNLKVNAIISNKKNRQLHTRGSGGGFEVQIQDNMQTTWYNIIILVELIIQTPVINHHGISKRQIHTNHDTN